MTFDIKCIKCGKCAEVCPQGAVVIVDGMKKIDGVGVTSVWGAPRFAPQVR